MTKDHQTDTDDLVKRLEDSKGWPRLGKAAAARIRADAEAIKAAEALAEAVSCITSRGVSPATGGRLILEVDIVKAEQTLDAFHRAKQGRDAPKDVIDE